jgi:predicted DNA-binding transcriptional regulator AlpA
MKKSKYQLSLETDLSKKAIELYKQGLTMREVGDKLGRSRTWVWRLVQKQLPKAFK